MGTTLVAALIIAIAAEGSILIVAVILGVKGYTSEREWMIIIVVTMAAGTVALFFGSRIIPLAIGCFIYQGVFAGFVIWYGIHSATRRRR